MTNQKSDEKKNISTLNMRPDTLDKRQAKLRENLAKRKAAQKNTK